MDNEIRFQFLPDGAGFEGATAYHGLSGELAVFAAALLAGEGKPISQEAQARLAGALAFSRAITKPDHTIVQVGDNDSGHFFKLTPLAEPMGLEECHLDQRRFQSAAAALLGEGGASLEAVVVTELVRGRVSFPLPRHRQRPAATPLHAVAGANAACASQSRRGRAQWRRRPFRISVFIYGAGSDSLRRMRCGPAAYDAHGAHAHNDQLCIELFLGGIAWTRDPGSFVYTPDLKARDAYRSGSAHFAPRGPREPGDFSAGPFRLKDHAHARMHAFNAREFLGAHDGFGETVFRRLRLETDGVVIEDLYGGSETGPATRIEDLAPPSPAALGALWNLTLPFSPGYGVQERAAIRSR